MQRLRSFSLNFLLVTISIGATFALAEYVFRNAIFSENPDFKKYRNAADYARDWDEDYWKLLYTWGYLGDMTLHPIFGWNYRVLQNTFYHKDNMYIKKRRPVLFYGDSFVSCVDKVKGYCFEDYLNSDSSFSQSYLMLNHGTGAHGVDQIYSLFKNTYSHYQNPVVLFGFMTYDLDRSLLKFRENQKPYYYLDEKGNLKFDNSNLCSTNKQYIKLHPIQIKSYLWRKFLFSDLNFLPKKITQWITGELDARKKAVALNRVILNHVVDELKKSKTDFMFVVFNADLDFKTTGADNWRADFSKQFLDSAKVPYLWVQDLSNEDVEKDSLNVYKYHIKGDGHPTKLLNEMVSWEIKKRIFEKKYFAFADSEKTNLQLQPDDYVWKLDSIAARLKNNPGQFAIMQHDADSLHRTVDEVAWGLATWFYWHDLDSMPNFHLKN